MSFSAFLEDKFGAHNPKEIDELILDGMLNDITSLNEDHKQTLEKYCNLVRLSLGNLGLTSLDNFPKITNLYALEINQNLLTGKDFGKIVELYPNLHKLKVSNNIIESIDMFKAFEKSSIQKLEVLNNPFMEKDKNAVDKLFAMLYRVKIINRENRGGEEIETTDYGGEEEEDEEESYNEEEEINEDDDDYEEGEEEENERNENEDDDNNNKDNDDEDDHHKPNKKHKTH